MMEYLEQAWAWWVTAPEWVHPMALLALMVSSCVTGLVWALRLPESASNGRLIRAFFGAIAFAPLVWAWWSTYPARRLYRWFRPKDVVAREADFKVAPKIRGWSITTDHPGPKYTGVKCPKCNGRCATEKLADEVGADHECAGCGYKWRVTLDLSVFDQPKRGRMFAEVKREVTLVYDPLKPPYGSKPDPLDRVATMRDLAERAESPYPDVEAFFDALRARTPPRVIGRIGTCPVCGWSDKGSFWSAGDFKMMCECGECAYRWEIVGPPAAPKRDDPAAGGMGEFYQAYHETMEKFGAPKRDPRVEQAADFAKTYDAVADRMFAPKRDPRINPVVGDVVKLPNGARYAVSLPSPGTELTEGTVHFYDAGFLVWLPMPAWRTACERAEIIAHGDEDANAALAELSAPTPMPYDPSYPFRAKESQRDPRFDPVVGDVLEADDGSHRRWVGGGYELWSARAWVLVKGSDLDAWRGMGGEIIHRGGG